MEIRGSRKPGKKIEPQMAPMIDVVFQLLVFFMLTLKIIEPENRETVNMPSGELRVAELLLSPVKVRLVANEDGKLADLTYGGRSLGNGAEAFDELSAEIKRYVVGLDGAPTDEIEAEIDADPELHWQYTMKAMMSVRRHIGVEDGKQVTVPLIEKIKFAPPREPGEAPPPA